MKWVSLLFLYIICFFLLPPFLQSQVVVGYDEIIDTTIDSTQLATYIYTIAGDEMEGRETGTEGQEKASKYIREKLKKFGLSELPGAKDYKQDVQFSKVGLTSVSLQVRDSILEHLNTYACYPYPNKNINAQFDKIYFAGYGIEDERYNDYRKGNFKDKAVIIYDGEPVDKKGVPIINGDGKPSPWANNLKMKLEAAQRNGVTFLLIIDPHFQQTSQAVRRSLLSQRLFPFGVKEGGVHLPSYMYISPEMAIYIIGSKYDKVIRRRDKARENLKPKYVKLKSPISVNIDLAVNTINSHNIAAYLKGKNKNIYTIVSAHYDHLGMRNDAIYNGADDNGTGTSFLLALAKAFSRAQANGDTLEQSILFLWVTGEEKGLLGSKYYVDNPLLPLSNANADINIDMIGRRDIQHPDTNYIYVIGSDKISSQLDMTVRLTHQAVYHDNSGLELDYTYNNENDPNRFYYRSDHYNFAKNGIPVVFFFSGVHKDYHMTTDTPEKIIFPLYAERSKFIAKLIAMIATNPRVLPRDIQQKK